MRIHFSFAIARLSASNSSWNSVRNGEWPCQTGKRWDGSGS